MKELRDMIIDANEVRRETIEHDTYKKQMVLAITNNNKRIQQAKERGYTSTCFYGDSKYEDELKEMYLNKGYSFKPTGVIGGVWQETVDICW